MRSQLNLTLESVLAEISGVAVRIGRHVQVKIEPYAGGIVQTGYNQFNRDQVLLNTVRIQA